MNNDNHEGAVLEDINEKLQRLLEGVFALVEDNREIKKVIADIPEMKDDIKAIEAAVTDQTRVPLPFDQQVDNHEARLDTLGRAG